MSEAINYMYEDILDTQMYASLSTSALSSSSEQTRSTYYVDAGETWYEETLNGSGDTYYVYGTLDWCTISNGVTIKLFEGGIMDSCTVDNITIYLNDGGILYENIGMWDNNTIIMNGGIICAYDTSSSMNATVEKKGVLLFDTHSCYFDETLSMVDDLWLDSDWFHMYDDIERIIYSSDYLEDNGFSFTLDVYSNAYSASRVKLGSVSIDKAFYGNGRGYTLYQNGEELFLLTRMREAIMNPTLNKIDSATISISWQPCSGADDYTILFDDKGYYLQSGTNAEGKTVFNVYQYKHLDCAEFTKNSLEDLIEDGDIIYVGTQEIQASNPSFTISNLDYGSWHNYMVIAHEDHDGVISTSMQHKFAVDFDTPTGGTITSSYDAVTNTVTMVASGFSDNTSGVYYCTFYFNGASIGEYEMDANGAATATVTLPDTYDYLSATCGAVGYDGWGNASNMVTTVQMVPDAQAPDVPTNLKVTIDAANKAATITWDVPYDNSGLVASYMVYLDGSSTGTETTTNSIYYSELSGKQYSVAVEAFDATGNSSGLSEALVFDVPDITAPTTGNISLTLAADESQVSIVLSNFWDDSGVIDHYVFYINGKETAIDYTVGEGGVVSAVYDVTGDYVNNVKFSARAVDGAGNKSAEASASVYITDVWAPSTPQNLLATKVDASTYTISWDASTDNSGYVKGYEVYVDGEYNSTVTSNYIDLKKLGGRTYTVYVQAKDSAGNYSDASQTLQFEVVDVTAPTAGRMTVALSSDSTMVNFTLTGFSDDSGYIAKYVFSANDTELDLDYTEADGEVTAQLPVTDEFAGDVTFQVVAYDAAGNASSAVKSTIELPDYQAPDAPTNLYFEQTSDTAGKLRWNVPYDNSGEIDHYDVLFNGSQYASTVTTNGMNVSGLGGGIYTFSVRAIDKAGNIGEYSEECNFLVDDVTAPKGGSITATMSKNNSYITLVVSGFTDDSGYIDHYDFYIGGKQVNIKYYEDDLGDIRAKIPVYDEYVGKVTFSVSAVDGCGNTSTQVSTSLDIKDTKAPDAPEGLAAEVNGTSATLSWEVPYDNSGTIKYYMVYLDGSSSGIKTTTASYTATSLKPLAHNYKVVAYDEAGNASKASQTLEFDIPDTKAPSGGRLSVDYTKGDRDLTLTAKGYTDDSGVIAEYRFYANDYLIEKEYTIDGNGYAVLMLDVSGEYAGTVTFGVIAVDSTGNESTKATTSVTLPDEKAPDTPRNLFAQITGTDTATFTWDVPYDNSGSIKYYMVYLDDSSSGSKVTTNSYNASKLGGGEHHFTVQAYDSTGNASGISEECEFQVEDVTAPSAGSISLALSSDSTYVRITLKNFKDDSGSIANYVYYVKDQEQYLDWYVDASGNVIADFTLDDTHVGDVSFGAKAVDAAGNESKVVSTKIKIADTVPPTEPDGIAVEITGKDSAKITWNNSEDNSGTVKYYLVYVDGDTKGTKVSTNSLSLSKLKCGIHYFTVQAFDSSDNGSSVSPEVEFTIDDVTAPSSGKLSSSLDKSGEYVTLNATGFSDDSGSIAEFLFFLDDEEIQLSYDDKDSSNVYATYYLEQDYTGTLKFGVEAVDAAGNVSKMITSSLTVEDTVAPEAPTGLTFGMVDASTANLDWDVPYDNSGSIKYYMVYLDGDTKGAKASSNTYKASKLGGGDHSYYVTAYDSEGNVSEKSEEFYFHVEDVTDPSTGKLSLTLASDQSEVTLTVSGFSDDSGSIDYYVFYLNDEELNLQYSLDNKGNIVAEHYLEETNVGTLEYSVKAVDAVGNESKLVTTKISVTDKVAPEAPCNLEATMTSKDKADLTWDVPYDNSGSVKYYMVYLDGDTKGVKASSNLYSASKLGGGDHSYYVTAYDSTGNISEKSEELIFHVDDVTAPSSGKLSLSLASDQSKVTLTVSGFSDDSGSIDQYVFYLNDEELYLSYTESSSGTITAEHYLEETNVGTLAYAVKALDAVGNESKLVTTKVTVTDKLAPEAPYGLNATMTSKDKADLTWEVPYDNSGSIKYYMVYLDGDTKGVKASSNLYSASKLGGGDHSYYVTAYDSTDNVSGKSEELVFHVDDVTAPTSGKLSLSLASDQSKVTLTVSGFSDDSGSIDHYVFYLNDVELYLSYTENSSGTITAEHYLEETQIGTLAYAVKALDAVGNESKLVTTKVTVTDKTAPEEPYNLDATMTSGDKADLTWEEPYDNSGSIKYYMVFLDGAEKGTKVNYNTYTASKLTPGSHSYTVQAYDSTGNASAMSQPYEFGTPDVTAPTTGKISAKINSGETSMTITVSNFKDDSGVIDEYYFYINDEYTSLDYSIDSSGTLTAIYDYDEEFYGNIKVAVAADDAAGNMSSSISTTVKVSDTMPPDAPFMLDAEQTDGDSATLSWNVPYDNSDSISYYMVYIDGNSSGSKTSSNYLDQSRLAPGYHSFYVTAVDASKNTSQASETLEFEILDITAPSGGSISAKQDQSNNRVTITVKNFKDDSNVIAEYRFFINDYEEYLDNLTIEDGVVTGTYDPEEFVSTTFGVIACDEAGNESKMVKTSLNLKDYQPAEQTRCDCESLCLDSQSLKFASLA